MTTLLSSALILLCNIIAISADCRNSYTSLPAGKTTYDIDDGGCFFCATETHAYETLGYDADSSDGAIPLAGKELNEHCESLCNADSKCIAYTVARPATLAADEYLWGKSANCCLDRMEAPEELYVDANDIDVLDDEEGHNNCQLGAMCWTRFERDVTGCTEEELLLEGHKLNGSDQCTMVWKVCVSIVFSCVIGYIVLFNMKYRQV